MNNKNDITLATHVELLLLLELGKMLYIPCLLPTSRCLFGWRTAIWPSRARRATAPTSKRIPKDSEECKLLLMQVKPGDEHETRLPIYLCSSFALCMCTCALHPSRTLSKCWTERTQTNCLKCSFRLRVQENNSLLNLAFLPNLLNHLCQSD